MDHSKYLKRFGAIVLCSQLLPTAAPGVPNAAGPASDLANSYNEFAVDLYQALAADEGNLFFSPVSLGVALSMTYAGAKNQTATEMQDVLCLPADPQVVHAGNQALLERLEQKLTDSGKLELANSLWPDRTEKLLDDFVASLKTYYGADYQALDFAHDPDGAAAIINRWVGQKTDGWITDLLQPGDVKPITRLALVNAIVFAGKWESPFDPEQTRPLAFHTATGEIVPVPGMGQKAKFGLAQLDGFSVLEMPFTGGGTSLVIALPDEIDGLAALEQKLTPAALNRWLADLQVQEVQVRLPRLDLTERLDLARVLQNLGMVTAFSAEADFTGISTIPGLFISKVIHQATLQVDEEGATAAAATAVLMERTSMARSFVVDRPFLLMIREKTSGSILFMGRVVDM